jgi:1,4-dihydroxy-2-naphthoyl-CoA synthase
MDMGSIMIMWSNRLHSSLRRLHATKCVDIAFNKFSCKVEHSIYKNLLVSQRGPVTIVQINRPRYRNAVDEETGNELRDAFRAFGADPTKCAAVLMGSEGVFCSGYVWSCWLQWG